MMKLGCSSVLFNQLDLYGALQHIAWAGYEGAELAILANHTSLRLRPPPKSMVWSYLPFTLMSAVCPANTG
jgi:sugar phosphate isomerase/epimerase